jgi:hypothetical protein
MVADARPKTRMLYLAFLCRPRHRNADSGTMPTEEAAAG